MLIHFYFYYTSATENLQAVPVAFSFQVCQSVSESVRPENLVNTMSQKAMKEISPSFGHRGIWVHRLLISFRVKGQGHGRRMYNRQRQPVEFHQVYFFVFGELPYVWTPIKVYLFIFIYSFVHITAHNSMASDNT